MRTLAFSTVVAVSFFSCSTVIDAGAYSHRCSTVTDCTPVRFGDACDPCRCANDAINKADESNYEAELIAKQKRCGAVPAIACECPEVAVKCTNQVCGL